MRLSEILKSETTTVSASIFKKPPAAPVSSSPPPSKSFLSVQELTAAIERAVAETRQQLEKDFQAQLESVKAETRLASETQLREEEKKFFARTEALKKEKQQLQTHLEETQRENKMLQATRQNLENAKKEISEAHTKQAEEFQKKIAELEIEHRRVNQKLPMEPPPPKPEPVISKPVAPPAPKMPEKEPEPKITFDPFHAEKARDLYQGLVAGTQSFFDRARQGEIQLETLGKIIEKFIEEVDLLDDLIAIISEPYSGEQGFVSHAVNSSILAMILGNDLKLSFDELRDLGMAALTHDIGLLQVKDALNYPRQLTGPMRDEISRHSEKGAELLTGHVSERFLAAVQQHHELMNGKGYPKGMQGEDIHLFARIISVVDAFEAMIHERPYRQKAMEINQAVKEMLETERGLYDRDVMKALLARVGLYSVKSLVELSNKQVARVLRQNRQFPLSPMVQVEFDENGMKLSVPHIIDLSKNQLVHILGPVKSIPSYTKERIEPKLPIQKKHKAGGGSFLKEAIPLLLMAAILALLVYLIVKI